MLLNLQRLQVKEDTLCTPRDFQVARDRKRLETTMSEAVL